ncbi:MAG: hypothetical protein AAB354_15030 [candidate division KSB1 bacterium]
MKPNNTPLAPLKGGIGRGLLALKRTAYFMLIIAIFLHACHSTQNDATTRTLAANDPRLRLRNGVLFYDEQSFSGALTEAYASGQLKAKTEYAQGRAHGLSSVWYENGQLLWQRAYRIGKKHGEHKGWWPNGAQKFVFHFAEGEHEGEASEWYANGQLSQRNQYEHGQEIGLQQAWRENGKLYTNYVAKNGKRYGLFNARLCYTVKNGEAQND